MNIHIHLPQLFEKERIKTEYLAWKMLETAPLAAEVDYLALPWSVVINYNHFDQLPKLSLRNGITVCQHIRFERILPELRKMGVKTLFTPHAEAKLVQGIRILPFPHTPVNAGAFKEQKDLWYSFIGFGSHPVRNTLFRLPPRKDTLIKRRVKWHFYLEGKPYQSGVDEYRSVLSRSRFSLCPRGTGPSTIRFWESLGAGAIPVLFADAMRLPPYDWESCMIRIPEKQAGSVNQILATISPEREAKMRSACLEAFQQFSGANLISPIKSDLVLNGQD